MDNATAKAALEQNLTRMLIVTSGLKISAQTKLKILSTYIHSQLLFPIRTYDLTSSWVGQTLDAICIRFIRDWLEMPISACVTEMLELPKSQGGLWIKTFKHLAEKMSLIKRHALRSSASTDVKQIWADTSKRHVQTDELLITNTTVTAAIQELKKNHATKAATHLQGLECQGIVLKCIKEAISKNNVSLWSNTTTTLPTALFNFMRKAIIQCLPTASNLVRWKRSTDPTCCLCSAQKQTNMFSPTAYHLWLYIDIPLVITTSSASLWTGCTVNCHVTNCCTQILTPLCVGLFVTYSTIFDLISLFVTITM